MSYQTGTYRSGKALFEILYEIYTEYVKYAKYAFYDLELVLLY
jgi:hypothetical protein